MPSLKAGVVKVLYRMQDSFSDASIVVASYDTLSRTSGNFSSKDFQMVIAVSKLTVVISTMQYIHCIALIVRHKRVYTKRHSLYWCLSIIM